MGLDAAAAVLREVTSMPISTDPVERIEASVQVRVLAKALKTESELTRTLLAMTGDVGRHLDVRG